MQEFTVIATAAECVIDYNIFQEEKWKTANYKRKITALAIVGSTNIGDFAVEIWVGETRKGQFYNTTGGANVIADKDDYVYPNIFVGANQEIFAKVVDAAAANNVAVTIKIDSVRSGSRRTTYNRNNSTGFRRKFMPYNQWVAAGRPSSR